MEKARAERFWAKVEKTDSCWLWRGALSKGYGLFRDRHRGNPRPAHIVARELLREYRLKNSLRNRCGTSACVNPKHWEPIGAAIYIPRERSWPKRPPKRKYSKRAAEDLPNDSQRA